MKFNLSETLKKLKIGKVQAIVLVAGLLGLVLLCVSSLPGGETKAAGGGANAAGQTIRVDLTDYEQKLEQRLSEIIGAIAGAGETRVMITLDCGSEPIYATQGKTDQKSTYGDGAQDESLSSSKECHHWQRQRGTGSGT